MSDGETLILEELREIKVLLKEYLPRIEMHLSNIQRSVRRKEFGDDPVLKYAPTTFLGSFDPVPDSVSQEVPACSLFDKGCTFTLENRHLCTYPLCPVKGTPGNKAHTPDP